MSWAGLGAEDRNPIRAALVRDQGWLCAYCQRRIDTEEDRCGLSRMKIEHWIPRRPQEAAESRDPADLRWSNLLGVCLGVSAASSEVRSRRNTHCDTHRGNAELFLHPVEGQGPDPREHLRYTGAGVVESARSHARVEADIRALNLNAPQLVRGRLEALDVVRERLGRSEFATSELKRIARTCKISSGVRAPEHAEFVRYHVVKRLRSRGETE
jgi:uncharacterized protein (TIGR02646 family)